MYVGNFHRKYQMVLIRKVIVAVIMIFVVVSYFNLPGKLKKQQESDKAITPVQTTNANLTVYFMDVGQGDATLLVSGDDAVLIDAGRENQGTKIRKYLKDNGIDTLNTFIMTHPDADHIGGAASVVSNIPVHLVYWNGVERDTKTFDNLTNELFYHNITPIVPEPGYTFEFGTCQAEVIAPLLENQDSNEMSIALMVTCGETKFLFTGDAEQGEEGDMVKTYGSAIKADVYKVGHHGSSSSSSEEFLSFVNPDYVVISCGKDNDYGHPHKETMKTLQKTGAQMFRTDLQGDIILSSDGATIRSNKEACTDYSSGEK